MIDEKQPAELPPVGSCLICGHEKPFGVWKADVGVCGDCRDKARARVETLPWGHSPIEPIVTLQLERDQALKDADDLRSENRRLEAQAAALRKALEWAEEYSTDGTVREMYREALRSDAGKALGEYVKLLERVLDLAYRYFDEAWKDRMDLKWSPSVELIGAIKAAKEAKP